MKVVCVWRVVVELAGRDSRCGPRGDYIGHALVDVVSEDIDRAGKAALEAACDAFEAAYRMDARPAWIRSRKQLELDAYYQTAPFDAVLRLTVRTNDYRTRIEVRPGTRRHII